MYVKMPFGLTNVGATCQRVMDISFVDEIYRFIMIYLDDITVFSKTDEEHLLHLRKVLKNEEIWYLLKPVEILTVD